MDSVLFGTGKGTFGYDYDDVEQYVLKRLKETQIMGTLKEYQCNGCGYTVTGTKKGRTSL